MAEAAKVRRAANDNWPLVLTRSEAAAMCQIGLSTFDGWIKKGILPGPIPKTRRWSRTAIESALADGCIAPSVNSQHSPFEQWRHRNAY
jgi:predicted DNA-binding transcriptional regulator AlpA